MNLVIVYPHDFVESNLVRLEDHRFLHIRTVLKAKPGERIRVGKLNGNTGEAILVQADESHVLLEVSFTDPPPPPLPVTLLCALPRPKTLKKVLQASVSIGVKRIFLMRTWRADKSYWQSALLSEKNLRQQCILGLQQARDTILPEIAKRPRFKPFVQDELPALIKGSRALVAHPHEKSSPISTSDSPVTLAVGPEGGFVPYEIDLLRSIGFENVSLGRRPLRVENAVVALLARLF
ncbi:MAG: 16S rRNA (uracil(1498)-N(3))-methyltransferase [Fibrobacterota bacterium]